MTYRTMDTANFNRHEDVSAPVRHVRRRRRLSAMRSRTNGPVIAGLGI